MNARSSRTLHLLALAPTLSLLILAAFGASSASAFVYWTGYSGTSVNRTTSNGPAETQEWVKGASAPLGVAVDAGHVYWANFGTNSIGRANLAGGEVEQEWIKGVSGPEGVAVDSDHVYWASQALGSIGRANLAGGEVEPQWIGGVGQPETVAVDAAHVYWTNYVSGSIGRANLNGTEVKQEWIKGISFPGGLAVDAGHIYWASVGTEAVGRANLAGKEVEAEWIKGGGVPSTVAVDAGHIYWANNLGPSIGRANLSGGAVEAEFRKASREIWGVAVDNPTAEPATTSLAFGSVTQGTLSPPQSITIANHGSEALLISALTLAGANPGEFLVEAGSCGSPVAPGASCTAQVRFVPQAVGSFAATVTVRSNALSEPVISLSGSGTAVPVAAPNTSFKKGPPGRSTNRRPQFVFGSNQPGSSFLCRLDKQKFHACKKKVSFKVKPGHHVLRVKAVSPTGVVDPTAAKRSFVVVAAGKG